MEVVKVYRQAMPEVKLVGRRYTNQDRDESGTFGRCWQQCFAEGWPELWRRCAGIPQVSSDLVGAMRLGGGAGEFEYWIGAFLSPDAEVPEGFSSVVIPAGEVGVCWLFGNEKNGELYSAQATDLSAAALAEKGWRFSEQGWFFERYHSSRFTPDEKGNVILDVCAYLVP